MNRVAVILLLIVTIIFAGCTNYEPTLTSCDLKTNIISLDRDMTTEGHFVLGTGSIESHPVYYYYESLSNGGYKLRWVSSKSSTIFEDENVTPYIVAHYAIGRGFSGVSGKFGGVGDDVISQYSGPDPNYIGEVFHIFNRVGDTEIHVPLGSIKRGFSP